MLKYEYKGRPAELNFLSWGNSALNERIQWYQCAFCFHKTSYNCELNWPLRCAAKKGTGRSPPKSKCPDSMTHPNSKSVANVFWVPSMWNIWSSFLFIIHLHRVICFQFLVSASHCQKCFAWWPGEKWPAIAARPRGQTVPRNNSLHRGTSGGCMMRSDPQGNRK